MTRQEFLKRWQADPFLTKAELIEGVVYLPSAVSKPHASYDGLAHAWLSWYWVHTAGCEVLTNATWMLLESAPQPDIALRRLPEAGGLSKNTPDGEYPVGPPELAIEICRSSRSHDLGPKLSLYQTAKVPEYLTVLIEERLVEWRILERGRYRLLSLDKDGLLKSKVFPGLWLDPKALFACDLAALTAAVRRGLRNREKRAGG